PHLAKIMRSNAIAPVFMAAFMDDDEIKAKLVVLIVVPIGYRRLMLHPPIRRFNELVAVGNEWIGAKQILEDGEHGFYLLEMFLCLFEVIIERIVIEIEDVAAGSNVII